MAELSTIARPYAQALFDAASEDGSSLDGWSELVDELAQLAAHPDVREALSNPQAADEQRVSLLLGLVKAPVPDAARRFIELLVRNGRLAALPDIATQFALLKHRAQGSASAEIVSAFELSDAQVAELVAGLEKRFGLKLEPTVRVEPSLIGGVRVTVGDQVLDTSVQAQLARMRDTLAA